MQGRMKSDRRPGLHRRLARTARRFAADSSGASAVEYAILAVLIAVAIAAIVFQIGGSVNSMFETVEGLFTN
jgi:pilus assembly protein Flp/PilA